MATIKELNEAINVLLGGGNLQLISAPELLQILMELQTNYAQNYIEQAENAAGKPSGVSYHLQLFSMVEQTIIQSIANELQKVPSIYENGKKVG